MATLVIDKVRIEQFKGFDDRTFDLYPRTEVIGKNGSGKTTLGDSISVLLTKRNLRGNAKMNNYPAHLEQPEIHITAWARIDDKPVTLEMFQKDEGSKNKSAGTNERSKNTSYRINAVDMSRATFEKEMLSRGIDTERISFLSNPANFLGLKMDDKRKEVFALSDVTDEDVCRAIGESCTDVLNLLLKGKTLKEIEAAAQKAKKEASVVSEEIPGKISGMETSKQEINITHMAAKKRMLEIAIAEKEKDFGEIKNVTRGSISTRIDDLNFQMKYLASQANDKRASNIRAAKSQLSITTDAVILIQRKIDSDDARISRKKNDVSYKKEMMERQLSEYNKKKEEAFPDSKTVCPTCGQKLQADKIEQAKADWLEKKEKELEAMKEAGNTLHQEISNLQKEITAAETELEKEKETLMQKTAAQEEARKHLEIAENAPTITIESLPEYPGIMSEIEGLRAQLGDFEKIEEERARKLSELNAQRLELIEVEKELAKVQFNEDIDRKIEELKQKLRECGQTITDADKILHELNLISKKKNEMLSENINSKFPNFIRFKLFEYYATPERKDEVKNVCIPEIRNEDGEWKELGVSANQALEMRGMLAILDVFQEHYNMRVPIIIDGASEIDKQNKKLINIGTQLIFLSVVDDAPLTIIDATA